MIHIRPSHVRLRFKGNLSSAFTSITDLRLGFRTFQRKITYRGLTGLRLDEECNKEVSARESSLGLQGLICVRLIDRNKQIAAARTTDRKPLRS